ncbi:diguanylate cyclase domain-containing protein [Psychromonas sp. KJ10-10]|uniref:diguanylate cyclase domain-containing protein n=1 Tax=Psychromonas sp. KJ10-10 TaxID=3391823 RepID=UPI0039B3E14B
MSLIDPRFESFTLAIVISTAGLASGGVVALLSSRMLTLGLYSALLLPTGFLLFQPNFDDITIVLIFLLYWVGMYSITKVQYNEYWLGLKSNFLIKRHAIVLEQLNTLDGLTGLKNRKYFDESLTKEMKNALRAQSPVSLLLIDIDHFKMINDTYGHLVGDECLRDVSLLLQSNNYKEIPILLLVTEEKSLRLFYLQTTNKKLSHLQKKYENQ